MKIFKLIPVLALAGAFWFGFHCGYNDERSKVLEVCKDDHKALIIDGTWYVCMSLDKAYPGTDIPPKVD